ncbi:MAG: hypothetical protein L3J22_08555 [Xanthomonadales bacterium]|nr:hypothetical protein [Xanthomonadales bacterium]
MKTTLNFLQPITFASCLLLSLSVFAQNSFSSLEERMTGEEFANSGLDKLSAEELTNLNRWIGERSVAQFENAAVSATPNNTNKGGFASKNKPGYAQADQNYQNREKIQARLKGPSKGWNNSTVFSLDNGMVWVMDEKDSFHMKQQDNPEVVIKPGFLNTWNLSIGGHSSSTKVERIQ